MAETTGTPNPWAGVWLDAQKKYLDTWFELAQQTRGAREAPAGGHQRPESTASDPWGHGLELWSKMVAPALSTEAREIADKLLDLSKSYLRVGEDFWKLMENAQAASSAGTEWQAALQSGLKQVQEQFTGIGERADPWSGFATFWGLPMDNWHRVFSSFSVLPGDVDQSLRQQMDTSPLQEAMGKLLSTPALGYTREWQEQVQKFGERWLAYQRALQNYGSVLGRVGTRAVELLHQKLIEIAAKGETLPSLRAAYNLWVDCGEQAYAEIATSPEFIKWQAELINTLMALKKHEQQMVDEVLSGLHMPTRREVDTGHRRMQDLRRELRALQDQLEEGGLAELRAELDKLRSQVEGLHPQRPSARGGAPQPGKAEEAAPSAPKKRRAQQRAKRG
jgi:polyhydroxyalkanoate synthase subunit PhaE